MSTTIDIAIVGAGHNGLVAAYYLAAAGYDVHLFERRPFIGGAAVTQELFPGYRFSTCAHMIHGIHPKIMRDLDLERRGLTCCTRLAGIALLPEGGYIDTAADEAQYNDDERAALKRYGEFCSTLRQMFEPYRLTPPPTLDTLRAKVAGTPAADVLEQAVTLRLSELHAKMLPTQRLRDRFAAEGQAVARDPLALHLAYTSMDLPDPTTGQSPPYGYPKGGAGTVSRTMAEAATEAGATIHVDKPIERIVIEGGRAVGIDLQDGTRISARAVLSNLDPQRTFLKLIDAAHLDPAFREQVAALRTNVSCTKLLAAIRELPDWIAWDGEPGRAHVCSVIMGMTPRQMRDAWDDFDAGRHPRTPTISFSTPSYGDPSLVDGDGHTASVWIYPAPARLAEGTWDQARDAAANMMIDRITEYAPNFRDAIIDYVYRTPLDLERDNGLTDGCIWHVQHDGSQLFWNRPLPQLAGYRAPVAGLYLCGAGQHPGGEVSGLPGHNAAHVLLEDWRDR